MLAACLSVLLASRHTSRFVTHALHGHDGGQATACADSRKDSGNIDEKADVTALELLSPVKSGSGNGGVKILCMGYTHSKKHDKARAQAKTWMHKCDDYFFASDKDLDEPMLGAADSKTQSLPQMRFRTINLHQNGGERYTNMWNKVRTMFYYAASRYLEGDSVAKEGPYWNKTEVAAEPGRKVDLKGDYDWFYISGDDNFVIVENLRKYLTEDKGVRAAHVSGTPLYLGRRYAHSNPQVDVFNTGGSGYLLNKHAVRVLVRLLRAEETWWCKQHSYPSEDVYMGGCLGTADPPIKAYDTRDGNGSERFHPFQPGVVLNFRDKGEKGDWFVDATQRFGRLDGEQAISKDAISFHYAKPEDQAAWHSAVYGC